MFGNEHAISTLGEIVDGMPETIIENEGETHQTSTDSTTTFDDEIKDEMIRLQRRRRKSAPDDVQIMAEEFQKTKKNELWTKLQDRLYRPLLKYITSMTPNDMLAEDACAITFARAYECIDTYDATKSKFSTWIWTIGYRQCLYDMKIERRIETVSMSGLNYVEEVTPENTGVYENTNGDAGTDELHIDYYMIDSKGNIDQNSCDTIIKKIYDVSLNAINDIQNPITKQVVESKIVHNMTIKEISVLMDMNQSNVKNHLYKGKREIVDSIRRDNADLYDLYLDAMHEKDLACG